MKHRFTLLLGIIIFLFSCSKYEIKDELIIDISKLTIVNIETNLLIINIKVNQSNFDYMYANYDQDIEVKCTIDMYQNKEILLNNDSITINIKGAFSASLPLKSLAIKFADAVDNTDRIILNANKLLPNHNIDELKKISLRNSGNDYSETYIKDISYSQLAIDLDLDLEVSYYKPVQVFINSKYYGLLNLRSEKSKLGLYKLLDVDKDDVNIIKINSFGSAEDEIEFASGDETILQSLVDAVNSENTALLKNKIDINSYVDYIIYQDMIGNSDWPTNNVEFYSVANGKFRFFLYDLDQASNKENYFVLNETNSGFMYKMYRTLKKDNEVQELLELRQREIINLYTYDKFYHIVDVNASVIENEIKYNIAKYGDIETQIHWYRNIEEVLNSFEIRREKYIKFYKL